MTLLSQVIFAVGPVLGLATSAPIFAQSDDSQTDAFKAWVTRSAHPVSSLEFDAAKNDLSAFGDAIRDSRIVIFGDAVEGAAEPLQMRNRLFRYLVEKKGFTTIVLESGILEGKAVDDYIGGRPGDFDQIMAQGITTGFSGYTGNRDLVRWMRQWNADPARKRKLHFFGFDISGSPLNRSGEGGVDKPLRVALAYLDGVDPETATTFHDRLDPLLPSIFWDLAGAMCVSQGGPWCAEVAEAERAALAGRKQYFVFAADQRDRLTATIGDLVAQIDRDPLRYRAASSPEDYDWGLRAAVAARQTDAFLRARVPVAWSPADGPPKVGDGAQKGRTRAMADNFAWILDHLAKDDKVLVYTTRSHAAGAPLTVGNDAPVLPFGAEIRKRYGSAALIAGGLVAEGEVGCGTQMVLPVWKPSPTTIDGMMASLNVPYFYVDLRRAPAELSNWLHRPQTLQAGGKQSTSLADAFDFLFYTGTLSAACPIDPSAFRVPLPPNIGE